MLDKNRGVSAEHLLEVRDDFGPSNRVAETNSATHDSADDNR